MNIFAVSSNTLVHTRDIDFMFDVYVICLREKNIFRRFDCVYLL